jgi:hypothetical protein
MMLTSIAALALSASASVSPVSHLMHKHPALIDTRVSVTLHNHASMFQDVQVAGRIYTIPAKQGIVVKAPVGTTIYAASSTGELHRGQVVMQLDATENQKVIELK